MKRVIAYALLLSLTLSLGPGCKKKDVAVDDYKGMQQEQTENLEYEMTELEIPKSLTIAEQGMYTYMGNSFDGFVADTEGNPAIYQYVPQSAGDYVEADFVRYDLVDDDWKETEICEDSLDEFLERRWEKTSWISYEVKQFRRGDDGMLYCGLMFYVESELEDGSVVYVPEYSLLQMDEDNDFVNEIPLTDALKKKVDLPQTDNLYRRNSEDLSILVDYHVYDDGNILLCYVDTGSELGLYLDGETGQVLNDLGVLNNGKITIAFGESDILTYSQEQKGFVVRSIPDFTELNVFGQNLKEEVLGQNWYYQMDPDMGETYLFNGMGIYSIMNYQEDPDLTSLENGLNVLDVMNQSVSREEEGSSDFGEEMVVDFFMKERDHFYVCTKSEAGGEGYAKEVLYRMVRFDNKNVEKEQES